MNSFASLALKFDSEIEFRQFKDSKAQNPYLHFKFSNRIRLIGLAGERTSKRTLNATRLLNEHAVKSVNLCLLCRSLSLLNLKFKPLDWQSRLVQAPQCHSRTLDHFIVHNLLIKMHENFLIEMLNQDSQNVPVDSIEFQSISADNLRLVTKFMTSSLHIIQLTSNEQSSRSIE